MAWIEKSAQGPVIRWRAADGSRLVRGPYASMAQAELAKREFEESQPPRRRRRKAGPAPVETLTLTKILAAWLAFQRAEPPERSLQPGYLRTVEKVLSRVFEQRGWTVLADISVASVNQWRLDTKSKGVERPMAYLRSVLNWAGPNLQQFADVGVLKPARAPHAKRRAPPGGLLTEDMVAELIDKARGIWEPAGALLHCLSIYGARPASYVRLPCSGYHRATESLLVLHVKHSGPIEHALFPETCALLEEITKDRHPNLPMHVSPWGRAWDLDQHGEPGQLYGWYQKSVARHLPQHLRGIKCLKYYAISRQLSGALPWPHPLAPQDGMLFTGHKTVSQYMGYARTNLDRSRTLVARAFQGQIAQPRAT